VKPRPIEPHDLASILALNNEHAAELSRLDEAALDRLLDAAAHAACVGELGRPEGFVLAFDHATPRQGPNHGWFLARHACFVYVDRVCVDRGARRRGHARSLYEDVFAYARANGIGVVGCEINIGIANHASHAFHERLGFVEIGRTFVSEHRKSVCYFERRLD
jgi:uncharacterized protein